MDKVKKKDIDEALKSFESEISTLMEDYKKLDKLNAN